MLSKWPPEVNLSFFVGAKTRQTLNHLKGGNVEVSFERCYQNGRHGSTS